MRFEPASLPRGVLAFGRRRVLGTVCHPVQLPVDRLRSRRCAAAVPSCALADAGNSGSDLAAGDVRQSDMADQHISSPVGG